MITLFFTGLIKLLASAGFGTIFGGVMGLFNRKMDLQLEELKLRDRQSQRAHELVMRDKDALIMEKEWAGRTKVAEIEGAAKVEESAFNALKASYDFAKPEKGTRVAAFSSFVRPFISIGYFLITSAGGAYIIYYAFWVAQIKLSTDQLFELVMFVIAWIAFMGGATIGWWFAMRPGSSMPVMTFKR